MGSKLFLFLNVLFLSLFLESTLQIGQEYGNSICSKGPIQSFCDQIRNLDSLQMGANCPDDCSDVSCDYYSPYRTFDGTCNNNQTPTWGATKDLLPRLQRAVFKNLTEYRLAEDGSSLPEPRDIRLKIMTDEERPNPNVTFTTIIFALIMAHDISFSTPPIAPFLETVEGVQCCPPEKANSPLCAPILFRENDPFFSKCNTTCLNFKRSPAALQCDDGRYHIQNDVTAFIDLHTVYGFDNPTAKNLRRLDGSGQLKTTVTDKGTFLPHNMNEQLFCPMAKKSKCFEAGDRRVNEHSLLMSIHTIWMKEHNRVAGQLALYNPHWREEKLFQEARKIVTAEFQAIAYGACIPLFVGNCLADALGLGIGRDTAYDPNIRVGALVEFATCANRPHTLVQKHVGYENLRMRQLFFNTSLIRDGHMDDIVKGICHQSAETYDRFFINDLSDSLYLLPGEKECGQDICSVDIARGRDHGLPRYVDMVKYCSGGKVVIRNWDDLQKTMSCRHISKLSSLYKNVRDIDLFVGIQLESLSLSGALVAPTTACILARQFHALKYGDRFYFEHPGHFSPDQLSALRQSNLARVLCDNIKIEKIQPNVFATISDTNREDSCNLLPSLNLSLWTENSECDN